MPIVRLEVMLHSRSFVASVSIYLRQIRNPWWWLLTILPMVPLSLFVPGTFLFIFLFIDRQDPTVQGRGMHICTSPARGPEND